MSKKKSGYFFSDKKYYLPENRHRYHVHTISQISNFKFSAFCFSLTNRPKVNTHKNHLKIDIISVRKKALYDSWTFYMRTENVFGWANI